MIQGSFRRLMMRSGGSQLSDAAAFLANYGPFGMVMDFTDASIAINDETDVLDYSSQGTVHPTTGALLGPGSKLVYSAPSAKLTEQADGYLGFQAHNLYLNSATPANQSITVISGATYAITITGSVSITLSGAATGTVTAGTTTFTAASGTLTCGSTSGSGTVHVRRTPSVSTYVATAGAIVYDLPYVYSSGLRTGILVEPAATNVHVNSNDLASAAWIKRGAVSVTKNQIGPDGVANSACRVAGLGASGANDIYEAIYGSIRWTASQTVAQSFYIKKVSASGTMQVVNASSGILYFSINFALLGSGWERITPTHPAVTTGTLTAHAGGYYGPQFFTSSGTLDFDIYCPQLEAGTVATSPIITYGAAVTRAVDTDTSLLNLFPSLGSAYTMYIRYKPASAAVATTGLRLDDTTANELVSIGNNASGQGLATVTDGGAAQAAITDGTITSSAFHRLAVSVEANNVLFVVNGGTGVQDTSVTLPTLTRMLLGNTSGQLVTQISLFPGARTEAQLQAIGA